MSLYRFSTVGGDRSEDSTSAETRSAKSFWILIGLCLIFLLLRLPVFLRQLPAKDEDFFAIPGWTILQSGVPQIAYCPERDDRSVFYRADEMMFTLPPLYFYWQACCYQIFGATTGIARIAATIAGLLEVIVLYLLARRLYKSETSALWASGLFLFSRLFYFPVSLSRPDSLCGMWGMISLLFVFRAWETRRSRDWIAAGLAAGLGMLTHPFAIVYCLQGGVCSLLKGRGTREKLMTAAKYTVAALVTFSLWGILIVQRPELFRIQFFNNLFQNSDSTLFSRIVFPWNSFQAQLTSYWSYAGPIQATLLIVATSICAILAARGVGKFRIPALLTCSGIYLHVTFVGPHPTLGYWCYTGALQFLCLGGLIAHWLDCDSNALVHRKHIIKQAGLVLLFVVLLLPGSGLRTLSAHLQNWDDINYSAPQFTSQLMQGLPRNRRLMVDAAYIFDFYREGYDAVLASPFDQYAEGRSREYDYLIGGPISLRDGVPATVGAEFLYSRGEKNDQFGCYAEVFRHPSQPTVGIPEQENSRSK